MVELFGGRAYEEGEGTRAVVVWKRSARIRKRNMLRSCGSIQPLAVSCLWSSCQEECTRAVVV